MRALIEFLSGKKTYLAGGLIIGLLFGTWQGWWKVPQEVYEALLAAGLIFLRLGVSKLSTAATPNPVPGATPATTGATPVPPQS